MAANYTKLYYRLAGFRGSAASIAQDDFVPFLAAEKPRNTA
jgi:hypothetical protein